MEELQKMIADLASCLTFRLAGVESKLENSQTLLETKLASAQTSVDATAKSLQSMSTWKSGIDTQVSDLNISVE